jgi:hypothetical protein
MVCNKVINIIINIILFLLPLTSINIYINANRIWETIAMLGYTWVWRLDDDSFILSPIKYNMFAFMEEFNYQYAYRNIAVEVPGNEFWDFMQAYIIKNNIIDFRHLMEGCIIKNSISDFNYDNCG